MHFNVFYCGKKFKEMVLNWGPLGGQCFQGCRKRDLSGHFLRKINVVSSEIYGDSYVGTSQNTTLAMPLWRKHCTTPAKSASLKRPLLVYGNYKINE